MRRDLRGP